MSQRWLFDTPTPWTAVVHAAPHFDHYREYFDIAIPEIAKARLGPARTPCVVVARVTARPPPGAALPSGPRDRAKGLMDALHDGRKQGTKYADLEVLPPLPDDDPHYVTGLAVEVQVGSTDTVEYRLGERLLVAGTPLATVEVHVPAPNDIDERARLLVPRRAYVEDLVRRCDRSEVAAVASRARALVIRHRPQRDEDNTWATWVAALTGGSSWSRTAWGPAGSPLAEWSPMAVASVADARLACEVRYEVYGAP